MLNKKMFRFVSVFFVFVLMAVFGLSVNKADAASVARFSRATGNWNTASTWANTACGNATSVVPLTTDTVTVCNGHTVTLDSASAVSIGNITVQSGGILVVTTGGTLTSNGTLNVNSGGILTVSGGTISMVADKITNAGTFNFSSGTVTVKDYDQTTGSSNMTGGTFQLSHDFKMATPGVFSTGGTVEFNGTNAGACETSSEACVNGNGAFNVSGTYTFYNLLMSGGTFKFNHLSGANLAVSNNFSFTGAGKAFFLTGHSNTANALYLSGSQQVSGTWGSSASTSPVATNQNDTYFAATGGTGLITVVTSPVTAPTLAGSDIAVNNSIQPNTVALTFNEALEPVQAVITSNWTVTNNGATITYGIASAVLSNSDRTVTLTLNAVDPADTTTFITNADASAHVKVTPNATNIKDVALNPYAGGTVTEAGGTLTLDSTPATVDATFVQNSATTFTVTFSEKVDKTTAETTSNYPLTGTCSASTGNATGATLQFNGVDVLLTVPTTVGCSVGETVIVTPSTSITDVAGVAITSSGATKTLILDTVNPDTTIDSGSISNGGSTTSTSITFSFSGTDDIAVASFECNKDSAGFSTCTSPTVYSGLSTGSHTFAVRAKDSSNNVDASPASWTWTITSGSSGGGGGGGGSGGSGSRTIVYPAVPAIPSDCRVNDLFSMSTGQSCPATPAIPATVCHPGDLFSSTNGLACPVVNLTVAPVNTPAPASAFGQAIKNITTNLSFGNKNAQVRTLQLFLISQNKGPVSRILAKNGVTTLFGIKTKNALVEWQKYMGITPATGTFGPKTRATIKGLSL